MVWKYPALYAQLARLCSNVQVYLVENSVYNNYNFAKNKERLMVNCIMELAIQYHAEKSKVLDTSKLLFSENDHLSFEEAESLHA